MGEGGRERERERESELRYLRPKYSSPYDVIARYIISGIVEMRNMKPRESED